MADREKIIRYYRGTEGAEISARLIDLVESVVRNRKFKVSEFLDPYGYTVAETIAANYEHISLISDGGYNGAERQRVAFVNDEFLGKVNFNIVAFKAIWNERYYDISHRDVLGALIGLGIERYVIGDILVKGDHAKIIVDGAIGTYIQENFIQIGAANVNVENCELSEIQAREETCKEIKATVASLRLDSVASSGFGSSRSKISDDIAADKLKINWQPAKSCSQSIKEGDIISMRGRGRVEVAEIRGQTKKGRIGIILKRYI
ncbi:MAG: RNA-binding domain protein [Firmicutes bacterium]|nr:RNA-binding domain protein [Bacillota bacterium]